MATKKQLTPTNRKNPPDATPRNVRAAKARTNVVSDRIDACSQQLLDMGRALGNAVRRLKTFEDELFKALQRVDALEKRQKQLGQLGANVVERLDRHDEGINECGRQLGSINSGLDHALGFIPTLAERVIALERRTEGVPPSPAVATINPAADELSQTLTPEQLAALAKKPAKRKAVRS